ANTYLIIEISYNPTATSGSSTATVTLNSNSTTAGSTAYTFNIMGTASAAVISDFTRTTLTPTFSYPYALIYGPDDYLWLTERGGKKINRVNKTTGAVDLLLDMTSLVYYGSIGAQDGLLGMALHPNLGKGTGEDYVYVAYSYGTNATDERLRIVRYTYSNPTTTDGALSSPLTLIEGLSASNDHNSGKLAFGPDNKLYYTIGDQGVNQFANKCEISHAQLIPTQAMLDAADYSDYEGKILRMNLDGSIPSDNPVINGVRSHIFTYGHRNAQGLFFGKNGNLYSSEHGPKSDDEINILKSGGNYGWPYISGYKDDKNYEFCDWHTAPNCTSLAFSDYVCGAGATSLTESSWNVPFINPITTLFTIDAGYNFTGGWLTWPTIGPSSAKIYEGFNSEIPGWDNSIFLTTLKKGRIYRQKLSPDGNSVIGAPEELFYTQNRYRDVAFDPDGKTVYIITDSGGTTSGPSGSSSLTVTDLGKILVYTYNPALVTCVAPIPDVTNLPTVTDNCSVTLTAPTATNSCAGAGGIVGTTTTVFPITTQGTTTVTWSYNYGSAGVVTQDQTVTINSTTWDGTIWSNGTPDATKGAIIASNLTVSSDLSTCSLTVNNNAIVAVNSGVNFNISGDIKVETGASLTFESNSNLVQTKETNGNIGNITVKRKTNALKFLDYVLWASPVASQQLQLFSPSTLATRFYTYNSTTNLYNLVTTPSATNFNLGTGYLIRMPNNHPATPTIWEGQFQGIPNSGNLSLTVDYNKYNAIGNPYPSTINADTFIDANLITEALYFWRKTNNAATTSYATYTKAGGTANAGGGSSIVPNGIIQVGQGFIYKPTSAVLTFTNTMRLTNTNNQFLKTRAVTDKSRIWLNLSKDTSPVNQMMIAYMTGATSGIDPAIDGRYINDNLTALNSLVENEEFVIQGRSTPFDNTDIVPLAFKAETSENFTIAIDHIDGLFSGNQEIILRDNITGTETDLKTGSYTFTASAGIDNARFSLKYQKTLGTNNLVFDDNSITVYKYKGAIFIKSGATAIDNVQLFDIKGSLLFEKMKINSKDATIESSRFGNQVLIVKITSDDHKVVNKKLIN
ncbi:MAG: PQQ-dependent sugar dehydrogenase, partial [Flavobacterium sp.]|uniref:glucose/sorbosone family PQQ-dependent dehydrogenase n=1 Tax=Flavobacterium sp. TaxID=239 RepID=UPI00260F8F26